MCAVQIFTFHYSFFTIHYSLDPLGAVTYEKPPRGVYRECGESHAAAVRREMEAGTARCPRGLPARPRCMLTFGA